MKDLNFLSLIVGSISTLIVGLVSIALSKYLLFKTKIFWSIDSRNTHRIALDYKKYTEDNYVYISSYNLYVKGWEPARNVLLHLKGNFTRLEVNSVGFFSESKVSFTYDKENSIVKVGRLEKGSHYRILITLEGGSPGNAPTIESIESENATVSSANFTNPKIETLAFNAFKNLLMLWGAIWAAEQMINLFSKLLKVAV